MPSSARHSPKLWSNPDQPGPAMAPSPNLDDLYVILSDWARRKTFQTYTDLSHAYRARTNDWFEPHGSWDAPLGSLNRRLHSALNAPAISALVVRKPAPSSGGTQEPGGGFWGCAPNVPPRPQNDLTRVAEWSRILNDVFAYAWPATMP